MRRLFLSWLFISALSLIFSYPSGARAESFHPQWTRCTLIYGVHGGFQSKSCRSFALLRDTARPIGHRFHQTPILSGRRVQVLWPIFPKPAPVTPAHATMYLPVTGYSWGCGTPNGITASGTVPSVGTVASNLLPIGAHVYVPSLGYSGVVLDRGAPLDLFAVNCAATYAYTGYRAVEVW